MYPQMYPRGSYYEYQFIDVWLRSKLVSSVFENCKHLIVNVSHCPYLCCCVSSDYIHRVREYCSLVASNLWRIYLEKLEKGNVTTTSYQDLVWSLYVSNTYWGFFVWWITKSLYETTIYFPIRLIIAFSKFYGINITTSCINFFSKYKYYQPN